MQLDQIVGTAVSLMVGRLVRRAIVAAIMGLFALIAVYQFTVAGTIALEIEHGTVNAHLIVAGIYVVLAVIAFATFWAMRTKPITDGMPAVKQQREMQLIMLLEALMLGYALARKGGESRERPAA